MYLGIFYNTEDKYALRNDFERQAVWIANRNNPISDGSWNLTIDTDGLLKIFFSGGTIDIPGMTVKAKSMSSGSNTSATLLDDGNLVLRQLDTILWQSFDYPTHALLPGMRLGINLRTGHRWSLTSWRSDQVPADGPFTLGIDPNGKHQLIMWWRGSIHWTSGLYHHGQFEYLAGFYNLTYVSNENERYFMFLGPVNDAAHQLTMLGNGEILRRNGLEENFATHNCFGNIFGTEGCVKEELPMCRKKLYKFYSAQRQHSTFEGDSYRYDEHLNLSMVDCQSYCLADCSCVAFGSTTNNGTGCEIWFGSVDISPVERDLRTLYTLEVEKGKRLEKWLIIAIGGTTMLLSIFIFSLFCLLSNSKIKGITEESMAPTLSDRNGTVETVKERPNQIELFSLDGIKAATNNFSEASKLGEGGFGPVYKGDICGQNVAIKRLSRNSRQGLEEFKNEIQLIAGLQHNNLVRLVGICMHEQEKLLVYEYMSNGSLDHILFDPSKRGLLSWKTRIKIIVGIAQGLLYLHMYSRLKVIHRDLKAGNVLLDQNMNPKISDFGMARLFEAQESQANTKRIVGTYAYMSPEYIINGVVSMKTDVFSYGVLLLEIISGKKNRDSYDPNRPLNLIGLAWELWIDGRPEELIDPMLDYHSIHTVKVLRCINIGLLCVQDNPSDRPSIMDVASLLANELIQLPSPKKPAFFIETNIEKTIDKSSSKERSINGLSFSIMEAR